MLKSLVLTGAVSTSLHFYLANFYSHQIEQDVRNTLVLSVATFLLVASYLKHSFFRSKPIDPFYDFDQQTVEIDVAIFCFMI
jgi:hypothetical protein